MSAGRPSTMAPERAACARCGLDCAAWRILGDDGVVYCTSFCASACGALEPHGEELDAEPPGAP